MVRPQGNRVLRFGRLFHQWLVDSYYTLETCRMRFHRENQARLRMDAYQGVVDQILSVDGDMEELGRRVVLP